MAPKLAEKYSDLRKQQILTAAWECFVEKGYRETTMREIARLLDASTGVIYTYFTGKDEILEALLARSLELSRRRFDEAWRSAGRDAGRSAGRDAGAVQELFSSYLECCPVTALKHSARGNIGLWAEALRQEQIGRTVSDYLSGLRDSLADVVRSSIEAGSVPAGLDSDAVAGFYLAFFLGLELQLALVPGLDSPGYIESIKKLLSRLTWTKPEVDREAPQDQIGQTRP